MRVRLLRNSTIAATGAALVFALSACQTEKDLESMISTSSNSTVASLPKGVYLKVLRSWEGEDNYTEAGTCSVPLGASASVNCTLSIPEAQLHYSKFRFVVGSADSTNCALIVFQPYYYRLASTMNYGPIWDPAADLDCTDPTIAGCYNGPATKIVSDFPKHTGKYFLIGDTQETSFDVDSTNSLGQPLNEFMTNNLTVGNRGNTYTAGSGASDYSDYVGDSMQDYVVSCRDIWNEDYYTVTLTLSDEDLPSSETPGATTDHFPDWEGL